MDAKIMCRRRKAFCYQGCVSSRLSKLSRGKISRTDRGAPLLHFLKFVEEGFVRSNRHLTRKLFTVVPHYLYTHMAQQRERGFLRRRHVDPARALDRVAQLLQDSVFVLTGAGVSVAAGIPGE